MQFTTPEKVTSTIRASDEVEQQRGLNRVKINNLLNGVPMVDPSEATKMNLKVNANFGEGPVLASHAVRQYTTAFAKSDKFFRVGIPLAPEQEKIKWEMGITRCINKYMKRSLPYWWMKQYQFASIVAHGIGPLLWYDEDDWRPKYVAIEDFRVATDTEVSLENLEWFAVRVLYTEGMLVDKVYGENTRPGWNKKAVTAMVKSMHPKNVDDNKYDWTNAPEKMAELVKQNMAYYTSDAVPTSPLWHFYYRDMQAGSKKWFLKIVPDLGVDAAPVDEFIYDSDKPAAERLDQLLHIQFGDLNHKPPFMYHSVRSLGYLLMEPCFWSNLMTCRMFQHGFEHMNVWLRVQDPAGKGRAQMVDLYDQCIVPEGVSIIPQNERHQIDNGLIESILARTRQLMQEAAASYTQNIDSGTQKEQTAYETAVKLSMVNAMMGGLLNASFFQTQFEYREVCRRFCKQNSTNDDVKGFWDEVKRLGIPPNFMNVDLWDIEIEIPLGGGNPTVELAQANLLMANREKFEPTAQQEILHDWTAITTGNWRKAERLVPMDKQGGVTDAQRDAEFAFGTLMQGVPVRMKEWLNPIDQIETFLGLMAGKVAGIEQMGIPPTAGEVRGLMMVGQQVQTLIQGMSQDPGQAPRAKAYQKSLDELMKQVQGFQQQLQEQQDQEQQDQGGNGKNAMMESMAKIKAKEIEAAAKARATELKAEQNRRHREMDFQRNERRKDAQTYGEITRSHLREALQPPPDSKPESQ